MSLTTSQLDAIARQVYRQFPEVRGERPAVQRQAMPDAAKTGRQADAAKDRYVVTFKSGRKTADGRTLVRIVRATADERGRILKISTSK